MLIHNRKQKWGLFTISMLLVLLLASAAPLIANEQTVTEQSGEPHNCRMWGIMSEDAPASAIQDHLINLTNSLENLSPGNPDGWAVVYYPDGSDVPNINRGFPPAFSDPLYDVAVNQAATATPRIAVAHVRNTSSGVIPASGNPHPFERIKNGKHWLMEHNGTTSKSILLDLIRPAYFAANPPLYGSNIAEWIDSDLYHIFMMQTLEDFNWNVKPAIGYVIRRMREEIPSNERLNFILTDGINIWAYREGTSVHTLYYMHNTTDTVYSVVASQYPSTTQGDWVYMANGELVTLSQNMAPVLENVEDYFGDILIADNFFDNNSNTDDLTADSSYQDWYESRTSNPELVSLNTDDVSGNGSNKAAFEASATGNAYLSQEFSSAQSGMFAIQWDIYIDSIADISAPDRAGWMLIGDNTDATRPGPNSDNSERFVYLAFFRDGGGGSGMMDLVARDRDDGWTAFSTIVSGLNLDEWYTIKVVCDISAGTYDVYLNDAYQATVSSRNVKTSVTHISFAQWDDGVGSFFVDNVYEVDIEATYTLTMAVDPTEGGSTIPGVGDHVYSEDEVVAVSAIAASGYEFANWTGDVADPNSASTTILMDSDETVTAHFSLIPTDFLADNDFDASFDSDDLRADSAYQDWYESRDVNPGLLTLNTDNIGGNTGAKAALAASASGNAYLSQEFDTPQTGTFAVQWDIYVDSIVNIGDPDRAGFMLIGDETHVSSPGPNSNNAERFVYMAFYRNGGGGSGTMDLVARDRDDGWTSFTTIATGLMMDQWYTIMVVCDLNTDTYDIFVNGAYQATVTSRIVKSSVTHISFAQWNDGAGTFFVDNVYQASGVTHTLTMDVSPGASGTTTPAVGSHIYAEDAVVGITAVPNPAYEFDHWDGSVDDPFSATTTVLMNADQSATAYFSLLPGPLLVDNEFDISIDSDDLRADSSYQDWYESREANPELLTLNTDNIGGNTGPKAAIAASSSGNVYLSQDFGTAQTARFAVEWNIYVDSIVDISSPDRTGWMLIGDDSDPGRPGPNSNPGERFVQMAFFRDGGGGSGTMDLMARERGAGFTEFTTVVSGLNLDQWYTIMVVCDLDADMYDIYVDSVYQATVTSYNEKASLTHISFAQWNDGAGSFFIDDVAEAELPPTFSLTMVVDPFDGGTTNPAEGVTEFPVGATVDVSAIANSGFEFDSWTGDVADPNSAMTTVLMDADQFLTAWFTPTPTDFLVDNAFDASFDTDDLIADSAYQDWYESREANPELLYLNTDNVGGNNSAKAGFMASSSGNAYMSQEFGSPQTGVFGVQWDVYIDSIVDISAPDRAAWMLIGDNSNPTRPGPNSDNDERFVYLAFARDGGGTSGTMTLEARDRDDGWTAFTPVATGLNIRQWYTIKVECNVPAGTYDVFVNDVYQASVTSRSIKTSLSHISFAQWNDGAGSFFIDNVYGVTSTMQALTIDVNPPGSGTTFPTPGTHTYPEGAIIPLGAMGGFGFDFDSWSGDAADPGLQFTSVVMDGAKAVTANFVPGSTTALIGGQVTCAAEGLHGVYVDLLDSNGVFFRRTISDEFGYYQLDNLDVGNYFVHTQMPMGFEPVGPSDIPVTISTGAVEVNIALAESASGSVTDYWWWGRQFEAIRAGTPLFLGITLEDVENYCNDIYSGYYGRDDGFEIQIEGVTYIDDPPRPLNFDDIIHIFLDPHDGTTASTIRRHLLADMLNVASEHLSQLAVVSADGATASQAIAHYANRYATDGSGDWTVWFYLSQINQSIMIPAGQVSLATANVMYGGSGDIAQPAAIACPADTVNVTVCGTVEVCVELVVENYDAVTVDGATWSANQLCFNANADSVFTFHVEATSTDPVYDPAVCDISISVGFVGSPVITCPEDTADIFTCIAGQVCTPLPITNHDGVNVSYGEWVADQLCFDVDTSGIYVIDIEAINQCDTSICTAYMNVDIGEPVSLTCPEDTIEAVICDPGEVCVSLPIGNFDNIDINYGVWLADEICFTADTAGLYHISVSAMNECDTVVCEILVSVAIGADVVISCPTDTIELAAGAGQVCVDLPITGATAVDAGDAVWSDNSLCFNAPASGIYEYTVIALNPCVAETCDVTVDVDVVAVASLHGYVTGDGAPLMGVYVNLLDSFGDPFDMTITDEAGYYRFEDIPNGDYIVDLQIPLGFAPVTPPTVPLTLAAPDIEVDFELTNSASGSVTDFWWWRSQFSAIRDGSPLFLGITLEDAESYCGEIFDHFYSRDDGYAIQIEDVTYTGDPAAAMDFDDMIRIYLDPYNGTNSSSARRHLLITILNVASEHLNQMAVVSNDGATASQAITYFADWYLNGNPEDWQLWYYASLIHMSIPIPAGVIPLSTPNIMFKPENDGETLIPDDYVLYQNYPNPFNPITEIKFSLPTASNVRLDIYNIMGQNITTLMEGRLEAGIHSYEWNAGSSATGVYFYQIKISDFIETKKMILLK